MYENAHNYTHTLNKYLVAENDYDLCDDASHYSMLSLSFDSNFRKSWLLTLDKKVPTFLKMIIFCENIQEFG